MVMENVEKNFNRQLSFAQTITKTKQKEWLAEAKKFVPTYSAEYLFYPKTSVLDEMLRVDPEKGFIYDPEVLMAGIETVIQIMKANSFPTTSRERLSRMYLSFADAETRIEYLRRFVEYLDLYPVIGEEVISDLKQVSKNSTDPEFLETLEARIKVIENQIKSGEPSNKSQREF